MNRVMLFLGTNLAVLVMLGLVTNLLGPVLGINPRGTVGLLILAGVVGFTGSFISLAASKWLAKSSTGAVVIENPRTPEERWLVETVRRQAEASGIGMPEVAIYDAPDLNAFATGMSRNNALVAVSTGLLRNMSRDEVEAVLAHEVGHVANGDMVTMALIQGVLNTFVFFISRVLGLFEGIHVRRRAVLASGVVLTAGTVIHDLVQGRTWVKEVPEGAVVVSGSRPASGDYAKANGIQLATPVIVKYRDPKTDAATALEEALR